MNNPNREQELWKEIDRLAFWSSFIAIILFTVAYFLIAQLLTNSILRDFLLGIIANIIPVLLAFSVSYIFLRKIQSIRSEIDNEKLANQISASVTSHIKNEFSNLGDSIKREPQKASATKVKILFLGSNPKDTPRLELSQEIRTIRDGLRGSKFGESFELIQELGARKSDLQSLLVEHQPNILHYSGHSSEKNLVMEDANGRSALVSESEFCKLISIFKSKVQLVILNGSSKLGESVAREIDHVIGTEGAVSDDDAIEFTSSFYHALGNNVDLETAYDLACARLAEKESKYLYFKPKKEGRKFLLQHIQE